MKRFIFILSDLLICICCFSQTDYSGYYKAKYSVNEYSEFKDYQNGEFSRCLTAFTKNKPLPSDLIIVSNYYYKNNNHRKGRKYLLKASLSGLKASDSYYADNFDSILKKDKKLESRIALQYKKYLKTCDIENSIKILSLLDNDQTMRSFLCSYETDTTFYSKKWSEVNRNDSINYLTLIKILNSTGFNSAKLTLDAKLGMAIILMHSTTNHYANADSIFAILKKEMLKGVVTPEFYANCIDRYYGDKGQNYYCKFYDRDLPIYDIVNVDKRRSEVWLPPLYYKFKWNKQLDQLPKDYIYLPDKK